MINVNNVSYTVIVITEKKLQLNITQAVEELGWKENEDELAMKIHFNMYNALYNKERLSSLVKINSVVVVKAYWGAERALLPWEISWNVKERFQKVMMFLMSLPMTTFLICRKAATMFILLPEKRQKVF